MPFWIVPRRRTQREARPQADIARRRDFVCCFLHLYRMVSRFHHLCGLADCGGCRNRAGLKCLSDLYCGNRPCSLARSSSQPQSTGDRLRHHGGADRELADRAEGSRAGDKGLYRGVLERALWLAVDVHRGGSAGDCFRCMRSFHPGKPALAGCKGQKWTGFSGSRPHWRRAVCPQGTPGDL